MVMSNQKRLSGDFWNIQYDLKNLAMASYVLGIIPSREESFLFCRKFDDVSVYDENAFAAMM